MPRIFAAFVAGHLLIVLAVAGLGLLDPAEAPTRHVALALFALLLSCLLQVMAFMYLAVTGKIIVQAVHLGDLELAPVYESKRLKKQFARILAAVVVALMLVTATGAYQWREGVSSWAHLSAASGFILVHLVAAYLQFALICRNKALVSRVLKSYTPRSAGASAAGA